MRVGGTAGIALEQNGVPEPIRQGVLRLVAHLFAARDGGDGAPPAAVTALWRPYPSSAEQPLPGSRLLHGVVTSWK